jgi:hypothetical protein
MILRGSTIYERYSRWYYWRTVIKYESVPQVNYSSLCHLCVLNVAQLAYWLNSGKPFLCCKLVEVLYTSAVLVATSINCIKLSVKWPAYNLVPTMPAAYLKYHELESWRTHILPLVANVRPRDTGCEYDDTSENTENQYLEYREYLLNQLKLTYTIIISSPFSTGKRVKTLVARQEIDQSGIKNWDPSLLAEEGINNGQAAATTKATERDSRWK